MSSNGMPAAGTPEPGGQTGSRDFAAPLGSATSGCLLFVSGASNVTVHADLTMGDLYRARFRGNVPAVRVRGGTVTVRYPRFSSFDWLHYRRKRTDEVALGASIPWHIEVRGCTSGLIADLSGLKLRSLDLSGGASRVGVTLPEPSGTVSVRILGGASNVTICRPEDVAAWLHVEGGSTNLVFDEEHFGVVGGEVDLRTLDYDDPSDRYDITITGGANNLSLAAR